MATWIDYKELRRRLSFADVLKHYGVDAKVKGDRAYALCPLPAHPARTDGRKRTPSLSVNFDRNIFQCFGCKASGNAMEFAAMMEGFDPSDSAQFRQAALKVAQIFSIGNGRQGPASSRSRRPSSDSPPPTVKPQDKAAPAMPVVVNAPLDFELKHLDPKHRYLSGRGLSPQTIEHFGLGFCGKGMMKDRVAIPLHDQQGQLIGYAGRLVNDEMVDEEHPKYLLPGTRERDGKQWAFHKSEFLFNGHRIQAPASDLIVVEGFFSTFWLHQHGYPDVVSLMGSSVSPPQCRLICELLEPDGRLWLMPDAGEAGEACATSVLTEVAPHRLVRWVKLEEGQPTDLVADELAALLWPA